eukprot:COSAG02_NODE_2146_length_9670_cov_7.714136_8_plen_179_part_00
MNVGTAGSRRLVRPPRSPVCDRMSGRPRMCLFTLTLARVSGYARRILMHTRARCAVVFAAAGAGRDACTRTTSSSGRRAGAAPAGEAQPRRAPGVSSYKPPMTVSRRFAAIGNGLSALPAATSEPAFVPQPALIGALDCIRRSRLMYIIEVAATTLETAHRCIRNTAPTYSHTSRAHR